MPSFDKQPTNDNTTSNANEETPQTQSTETAKEENQLAPSFMIFVPYEFSKDKVQIVRLLFIISEKDDYEADSARSNKSSEKSGQKTSSRHRNKSESETKFDDGAYTGVRRLSSSNSFLDNMNSEILRNVMMNKLSKIANINPNKVNAQTNGEKLKNSQNSNYYSPGSAFIITPNSKADGYLIYLKMSKNINGKHLIHSYYCLVFLYRVVYLKK
jgi:hypothetical protein